MDDEHPHELAEDGEHLKREAISMPSERRHDEHPTRAGEGKRAHLVVIAHQVAQSVHRARQQQRHIEHSHEEEREREQHAEGTRRARVGAPEELDAASFSYLMRGAIRMHSACALTWIQPT